MLQQFKLITSYIKLLRIINCYLKKIALVYSQSQDLGKQFKIIEHIYVFYIFNNHKKSFNLHSKFKIDEISKF